MNAGSPSQILRDARAAMRGKAINVPCGTCTRCCRADFPVPLTVDEAKVLPHQLDESTGRRVLRRLGRDCIMFDPAAGACSIYDDRPRACRTYDCRQQWLTGMRNTGKGLEINERVEQWRAPEALTDLDRGVLMRAWSAARVWLELSGLPDVGPAVAYGIACALNTSDSKLRAIGRKEGARARAVLAVLNSGPRQEERVP